MQYALQLLNTAIKRWIVFPLHLLLGIAIFFFFFFFMKCKEIHSFRLTSAGHTDVATFVTFKVGNDGCLLL